MPSHPLFAAIESGDLNHLEREIAAARAAATLDLDPHLGDLVNEDGRTLATLAARQGFSCAFALLHRGGVNLDALDLNGHAAVHSAALAGHATAIAELKHLGANVRQRSQRGNGCAHLAAIKGHAEVLGMLGELGADLCQWNDQGELPAHIAAGYGHLDAMARLPRSSLNEPNRFGDRPVHRAVRKDHAHVLHWLHQQKIDLTLRNADGLNAAELATRRERVEATSALIQLGQAMPTEWPVEERDSALQCLRRAAVAAAIAVLKAPGATREHEALAHDLACPVSKDAFDTEGPARPVRWADGKASVVFSAEMVQEILNSESPRHPYTQREIPHDEREALLNSKAFLEGDANRMGVLRAVRDVLLQPGSCEGRRERVVEAAKSAVVTAPQWRHVLAKNGTTLSPVSAKPLVL